MSRNKHVVQHQILLDVILDVAHLCSHRLSFGVPSDHSFLSIQNNRTAQAFIESKQYTHSANSHCFINGIKDKALPIHLDLVHSRFSASQHMATSPQSDVPSFAQILLACAFASINISCLHVAGLPPDSCQKNPSFFLYPRFSTRSWLLIFSRNTIYDVDLYSSD